MTAARRNPPPERDLRAPLIAWLRRRRIAQPGALIAEEVFLHGKRIDIVLLSRTQVLSSFELKSNHSSSVLSQALLNTLSVDRSYVVTSATPSDPHLRQARDAGIGWLIVRSTEVHQVLPSQLQAPLPEARARLLRRARTHGLDIDDV